MSALTGQLSDPGAYLQGWAALARLMDEGVSWSGHERNCVFLNRGRGEFADVSALSGLDFDDDGRACVAIDLDRDGDLDLVTKNRSGPQLRILRNDLGAGAALMLQLRDTGSGNGSAIGARVELVAGSRRLVRCVTAGDGYLGQQSRWLHFGLDGLPKLERLAVRWPDGKTEEFVAPSAAGRYLAIRGAGEVRAEVADAADAAVSLVAGPAPPALPTAAAIVLRQPLVLPPTLARVAFRGKASRPALLALWSMSCATCEQEIRAIAARHPELDRAGLDVVLLGLHEPADQAKAALFFRKLLQPRDTHEAHEGREAREGAAAIMRQRPASMAARSAFEALLEVLLGVRELSTPVAFLVDANAQIQMVYLGALPVDLLVKDVERFGLANMPGALRTARGGRWAFGVERSMAPLVAALAARGLTRDASFYAKVVTDRRNRTKPGK